ncbi:hypothetical protein ACRALDRAFT_2109048 [Sodiomyces alcalophilus JCM 7366]|uniref:uncharacterized protein n=1 Tax=Sodiomyces alcalophilus JCM 7366 TaxID=591952 RepID=UPI0039B6256D
MGKPNVDYSLYLVTDSTPAILGDKDLGPIVEAACKGGVTLVQYRDKKSDTAVLIDVARRLHEITRRYGVPLLINDRIDVALAVGCEGVHIGQEDMDLPTARRILGPDAIIGISTGTAEEAIRAAEQGADYIGIGTVFTTQTKENPKRFIGTAGLRSILASLASAGPAAAAIRTVCIGGIKLDNIQRVIYQSATPTKSVDGVAIVSAIVAASDPEQASRDFLHAIRTPPPFRKGAVSSIANSTAAVGDVAGDLVARVPELIRAVNSAHPMSHSMTNFVVQNFTANVALAVGASPIMANYGEEAVDLAKLGGALVINMGTVTPEGLQDYVKALRAYNNAGRPVVFDPVGAGATALRRQGVKTILAGGYLDIIKGNEGEITTVLGESPPTQQRGVDSGPSVLDEKQRATIVRRLAARERNVVLMTGPTDIVSDGVRTLAVSNGHPLLSQITGTGCTLGTVVSAVVAAQPVEGPRDLLAGVVAALLHYEIAAERAAVRQDVQGPGTFVPALLDELARVRRMTVDGDLSWLSAAKVREILLDS